MPKISLLEGFQKQHPERKGSSKRITKNIRISSKVHVLLNDYCQKNGINKSNLLEQIMKNYLKYCQRNINFHPMTTEDYIIIMSNYDIDLRDVKQLDRRPFAFRVYENIYVDFCEQCEKNHSRICDVLEEMIASFLIQENNLSIVRVTKYSRLSEALHNAFSQRCKQLGIGKSELMEYFFSFYIERSRQNEDFQLLNRTDYLKIRALYHINMEKPTHIPRIICAFRLYEDLYDRFCSQCVHNNRRICDVIEEMIASFLLETEPEIEED